MATEIRTEFSIGVTAFGLYAENLDFNASDLVVSSLPTQCSGLSSSSRTIRILKYPQLQVTYDAVDKAVQDLWKKDCVNWSAGTLDTGKNSSASTMPVDFVVHVGQMRSYDGYSIEKVAHRDGYTRQDLSGNIPETVEEQGETVLRRFQDCPAVLEPSMDVDELTDAVQRFLPDVKIRASTAAGRFSCEYLLYSSLAELHRRGEEKKVLFVHVPADKSDVAVKSGAELLLNVFKQIESRSR